MEEFKNILLAGIGSAAYTYEKASKLVDEMVEKGKITISEGKELSEELKRSINLNKRTKSSSKEKPLTKEDIISIFNELNFVNKKHLDNINTRVESLENKISQLDK